MLSDYLPILMLLGLAMLFGMATLWLGARIGPSRPNPAKDTPYECGIVPARLPREQFPIKFYLIAMLFIIFDVEVIFFYPWAVVFRELRVFGLAEMAVFVALLLVAYVYIWRLGGLDWEQPVQVRAMLSRLMAEEARRPAAERPVEERVGA